MSVFQVQQCQSFVKLRDRFQIVLEDFKRARLSRLKVDRGMRYRVSCRNFLQMFGRSTARNNFPASFAGQFIRANSQAGWIPRPHTRASIPLASRIRNHLRKCAARSRGLGSGLFSTRRRVNQAGSDQNETPSSSPPRRPSNRISGIILTMARCLISSRLGHERRSPEITPLIKRRLAETWGMGRQERRKGEERRRGRRSIRSDPRDDERVRWGRKGVRNTGDEVNAGGGTLKFIIAQRHARVFSREALSSSWLILLISDTRTLHHQEWKRFVPVSRDWSCCIPRGFDLSSVD